MIPSKLQLYNFMSYGEDTPALDFAGIDLACLSGENGVGKSTLLEAMTWALWGKSRAKSDDELVKKGTQNMWVDFAFSLEEIAYRIVRKRSLRGKGMGSLDFMVQGGDGEFSWQSIAGTSKQETQSKIDEILKMDYETFINSAFIRQGKADEFTIKKATERKTVLAKILNLDVFDNLVALAKEIKMNKEVETGSLRAQIESLAEESKEEKEAKEEIKEILAEIKARAEKVKLQQDKVQAVREEKIKLQKKLDLAAEAKEQLAEITKELDSLKQERRSSDEEIEKNRALLERGAEIKKNFIGWQKLQAEKKKMEAKKAELNKLNERRFSLRQDLAERNSAWQEQINSKKQEVKSGKREIADLPEMKKTRAALVEKIKQFGDPAKERDRLEEIIRQESENSSELKEQRAGVAGRAEDLKEKIKHLKSASASCPLCRQSLGQSQIKSLLAEYQAAFSLLEKKIVVLTEKIDNLRNKGEKLKKQYKDYGKKIDDYNVAGEKLRRLEEIIADKEKKQLSLVQLSREIVKLEADLKNEQTSKAVEKELGVIEKKIKALNFNEQDYQNTETEVAALADEGIEDKYKSLEKAEDRLEAEAKIVARINNDIKKYQLAAIVADKKITDEEKWQKKATGVDVDLREQETILENLRGEEAAIREKYGAANTKAKRLESIVASLKEKKATAKKISDELALYQELAVAFGKNGIQAMIIESALPEIEQEANELLSRLTDGRMSISFVTQREKKTDGGLKETLDINIKDLDGEKSYEMFSGGERFRINFSIRVALSKLLSRRAGAKLKMLVVDEGFGTQDVSGREHLVEAINMISEEFSKIIVVTHIKELKDSFPIKIEVTKDKEGSHFTVVG